MRVYSPNDQMLCTICICNLYALNFIGQSLSSYVFLLLYTTPKARRILRVPRTRYVLLREFFWCFASYRFCWFICNIVGGSVILSGGLKFSGHWFQLALFLCWKLRCNVKIALNQSIMQGNHKDKTAYLAVYERTLF